MTRAHRFLFVMRHSKASNHATTDHDRCLSDQGHDDARATGAWLAGLQPEVPAAERAIVSSALRTRQTWEGVVAGSGWSTTSDQSEALYAAGPNSALDLVRELDESVSTAIVVGHNPTMGVIANLLDDGEGDPKAEHAMLSEGYPTSALAVFSIAGAWADLAEGSGRLVAYHRP